MPPSRKGATVHEIIAHALDRIDPNADWVDDYDTLRELLDEHDVEPRSPHEVAELILADLEAIHGETYRPTPWAVSQLTRALDDR